MKVKFTTKRDKRETGLAGVGQIYLGADIKLKGRVVGWIKPPNRNGQESFKIMFKVVHSQKHLEWVSIRRAFGTYEEAKEYLTQNSQAIYDMFEIKGLEFHKD